MNLPGTTGCTALVATADTTGPPPWIDITCGIKAVGPHPDPEKGYRLPLCRTHLVVATVEYEATT